MPRVCMVLFLALLLGGCAAGSITKADLAGEPTVFATVNKEPDPLLMGCYMRPRPSQFHRPNSYSYCLVKKGDKYAVYYRWRDGKTLVEHEGWMPFAINGDRIVSGTEPSTFLVKDGAVWHSYGGRGSLDKMLSY